MGIENWPPHEERITKVMAEADKLMAPVLGKKLDAGKLRYNLLPVHATRRIVEVLTFGANKYSPDGWHHVQDAKARYTAALYRHVEAWRAGETTDPESGNHHLAHAACCVIFLLAFESGDAEAND